MVIGQDLQASLRRFCWLIMRYQESSGGLSAFVKTPVGQELKIPYPFGEIIQARQKQI